MEKMVIKCPGCSAQLRVNTPKEATEFACPKCSKMLRLKAPANSAAAKPNASTPQKTPAQSPSREQSNRSPQPQRPQPQGTAKSRASAGQQPVKSQTVKSQPTVSQPVAPQPPAPQPAAPQPAAPQPAAPRPSAPQAQPAFAPQAPLASPLGSPPAWANPAGQQKKKSKKWLLIGILGVVAVLSVACVAGIVIVATLSPDVAAKLNPLGDTPISITDDFIGLAEDYAATIETISDDASAERAAAKIDKLAERCEDLQARAIAIGPLTKDQQDDLEEFTTTSVNAKDDRMRKRMESANAAIRDKKVNNTKLMASIANFQAAVLNLASTLDIAWKEIPEPENELQELERERIRVFRTLWRDIVRSDGPSDESSLTASYETATGKIKNLASKKRELENVEELDGPTGSPYVHIQSRFTFAVAGTISQKYKDRGNPGTELQAAIQELQDADYDFGGAGTKYDPAKTREDVEAERQAEMAKRREQIEKQKQKYAPKNNGESDQAPMSDSSGEVGPDSGKNATNQTTSGDTANDAFISRFGAENVVIINVSNTSGLAPNAFARQLRESVGSNAIRWSPTRDTISYALKHSGELSEVTSKIDWGKVQSTDETKRIIEVVANDR